MDLHQPKAMRVLGATGDLGGAAAGSARGLLWGDMQRVGWMGPFGLGGLRREGQNFTPAIACAFAGEPTLSRCRISLVEMGPERT